MRETRRNFLKATAAGSAALAVRPGAVSAADGEKLTVAAVGVGGSRGRYNRGGKIAAGAARLGKLIAVCDVHDLHTREFNEKHGGGLGMYRDYREMLDSRQGFSA